MRSRRDVYVYVVVMVLALVIVGNSLTFAYTYAKVFPLIIGGALLVLATIGLVRELAKPKKSAGMATADDGRASGIGQRWYKYLLVGAWLVGFLVGIYLVGFTASTFLLLISYLKTHDTKWFPAITLATLTTGIIYVVFVVFLQVGLFEGILLGARI